MGFWSDGVVGEVGLVGWEPFLIFEFWFSIG
jgi:hypothetical protein